MDSDNDNSDVGSLSNGDSGEDEGIELSNNKRKNDNRVDKSAFKKIKYENITEENKAKPKKGNNLYRQPTVEELNELKETEHLYNNNLFRYQIEELLSEVEIKNKHKIKFNTWFEQFQLFIKKLPTHEGVKLSAIKSKPTAKGTKLQKLINALAKNANSFLKTDQDITLNLEPPTEVETFGLYKINASVGPKLNVNIALRMSKTGFLVKDYSNNRYIVRRYFYLMYIAENLRASNLCARIFVEYFDERNLLPVLTIVPNNSEKITVRIMPVAPDQYFKGPRFLPDINNVKSVVFEDHVVIKNEDTLKSTPTLYYNAIMAFETTLKENTDFIETTLKDLLNVQKGIQLILIWLTQRELNTSFGSLTEEIVTYFVTHLVVAKKINKHMSSYQVVRNFWNFFIVTNFETTAISVNNTASKDVLEKFKQAYEIVFLDKTGCYNVTSFVSRQFYLKIKQECALALRNLESGGIQAFSNLFLTKVPFYLQYDAIIDINDENVFESTLKPSDDVEMSKFIGKKQLFMINKIAETLQKGYNKRALLIVPHVVKTELWEYGENINNSNRVLFGINLNPDHAFHFLEYGPDLNDPKEAEFRQFWGPLASDRRFRDGTAKTVVFFKTSTIRDKRNIIEQIAQYLLVDKLNLKNMRFYYNNFEKFLLNRNVEAGYPMGTNEETSLKVISTSDDLGKKIRDLKMTLSITGIKAISDVFSYSDVFPPIPATYKVSKKRFLKENCLALNENVGVISNFVKPIECALQLEHTARWPNELGAIRKMKTAFFLEISRQLNTVHNIISAVKPDCLDVFYEGLVFRYYIYLSKEIGLLKKDVTKNGVQTFKHTVESRQIEEKLDVMPKIISALKGTHTQYPSFGVSSALIKRFFRVHMLDEFHIPDVVINLLSVYQYINDCPYLIPTSPQVAFLRFLKLISETDWELQTIFVNFNNEMTKEVVSELDSKIQENRSSYPALCIITPYNKEESIFTKNCPTKPVLNRIKTLALAALNVMENIIIKEALFEVDELFIPNLTGYNAVIYLKSLLNPRRHESLNEEPANKLNLLPYKTIKNEFLPLTNFNPVQLLLDELRKNYDDFALFFLDSYGGNVIGVLWKPEALEPKEFKILNAKGRKLENDKLVLNTEAILEDFYILGKDVISSIDVI